MTLDKKQTMQFLFGDRELILSVADLLIAPVDVIVNPANTSLQHGGGVAGQISQQGGNIIQQESDQFIKEHGQLESGMVAYTTAGQLPFQAIIHAVGPVMGEGDEQRKIEKAVSRSLQLCDMNDWKSIAFPAISAGVFRVPIEVSARAFFRSITSFWDARMETLPEKVNICLTENNFESFMYAFRDESLETDVKESEKFNPTQLNQPSEAELPVGIVDLSEQEISDLENDQTDDWFK